MALPRLPELFPADAKCWCVLRPTCHLSYVMCVSALQLEAECRSVFQALAVVAIQLLAPALVMFSIILIILRQAEIEIGVMAMIFGVRKRRPICRQE